ncbi:MAG: helix-turn-helix transcriptional regulator [Desulfovibrionaceae bacterium]|nr:helix-turn-helix transcriptional regulator [Desulfovibrionaceae bacterium]
MEQAYKEIAPRLRGLRDAMGFDLEDMAQRVGASAEDVARFESGESEIPVGYLLKVSQACRVDLTVLISGDESRLRSCSLVRRGQGLSVDRRKTYDYRDLAYKFSGRRMTPFLIKAPAVEDKDLAYNSHPGQEFLYLLKGRLEARIGDTVLVLEPGDSLYFDSQNRHALRGLDGNPAEFLDVIL